jgi:hypothetical protein
VGHHIFALLFRHLLLLLLLSLLLLSLLLPATPIIQPVLHPLPLPIPPLHLLQPLLLDPLILITHHHLLHKLLITPPKLPLNNPHNLLLVLDSLVLQELLVCVVLVLLVQVGCVVDQLFEVGVEVLGILLLGLGVGVYGLAVLVVLLVVGAQLGLLLVEGGEVFFVGVFGFELEGFLGEGF